MTFREASCASCLLGVSRRITDGYLLIKCVRGDVMGGIRWRNPFDCCKYFLAPSPGYEYPKGSKRDEATVKPDLPPSLLVFDPWRGLVAVDSGEKIL